MIRIPISAECREMIGDPTLPVEPNLDLRQEPVYCVYYTQCMHIVQCTQHCYVHDTTLDNSRMACRMLADFDLTKPNRGTPNPSPKVPTHRSVTYATNYQPTYYILAPGLCCADKASQDRASGGSLHGESTWPLVVHQPRHVLVRVLTRVGTIME